MTAKYATRTWIAVFLIPTVLLFIFLYAYPLVTIFATSVTRWRLGEPMSFIGFENFIRLTTDSFFTKAFSNTLKWLVLHWVVLCGTAVIVALLTSGKQKRNRVVRSIYLLPNMIPIAVIGYLFYFIMHPTMGLFNGILSLFTAEPVTINWFQDPSTAFFAVTVTTIFYGGVFALLLSAEIASIPGEVIESAQIDGAGPLRIRLQIILPMIRNILGTVLILATVQCLKTFETVFLTTSGGPGKETMNLSLYTYRMGLTNSNFGYGNAISVMTILIGIVSILVITKLFRMDKSGY